jgi:hypothetical protein
MINSKRSTLWLAAMLLFSTPLPMMTTVAAASESAGSALPPGVNPSSPAGGNGGDAQGMDKKPVNPPPPGSENKAKPSGQSTEQAPAQKKTEHKKSATHKTSATHPQPTQ